MKKNSENLGQRSHRQSGSSREQTFDSAGPEGKIRGTAKQLSERYLVLGRDSMSAGDRVTAESCFQHAEHYRRVIAEKEANATSFPPKRRNFLGQHRQPKPETGELPENIKEANENSAS